MATPTLLGLPTELLLQLPQHMRNLEDFMHASSSCRHLHEVFAQTSSKTILQLASRSAPTFFSPDPYFLALATARQVAKWTLDKPETRTEQLIEAFRGGVDGLLHLALRDDVVGVGLNMADIRRVCAKRFSVINPLNATLDAMIGKVWYQVPDFWDGGADDAFTLYTEVDSATMQLLLYGELFASTMESFLAPTSGLTRLDIKTRIEFIKYCIPDWCCTPDHNRKDDFEVLRVGPFATKKDEMEAQQGNQTALAHLLGGAMFRGLLWRKAWRRILAAAGCFDEDESGWPDSWRERIQKMNLNRAESMAEERREVTGETGNQKGEDLEAWRFKLFWDALTKLGGLDGMEMVAQFKGQEEGKEVVMKPEWKARILQIRDQVMALDERDLPGSKEFGRRRQVFTSEAPDLGTDLYICCAGLWGGL